VVTADVGSPIGKSTVKKDLQGMGLKKKVCFVGEETDER